MVKITPILILTIKEPFLSKTQIKLCYHQNDSFKLSVSTIMFITYLFPYELINVYTITSTPFNTKPQNLRTKALVGERINFTFGRAVIEKLNKC